MEQPARELLLGCKVGDPAAWTELILAHQDHVARWLARLDWRLSAHDIADLRQNVFRKVVIGFESYQVGYPFTNWLFQQTRGILIDYQRAKNALKRRAETEAVSIDEPLDEDGTTREVPAAAATPDERAVKAEEVRMLQQALAQLGEPSCRCRQLIEFRYFGEFSYDEVAGMLGMNPKTVSTALSKCLSHLRELAGQVFSWSKLGAITNE